MRWRGWLPWRHDVRASDEALREAEKLRDEAQEQRRRATEIAPRVDEAAASLRQLRTENHFGPMIENILRGSQ